MDNARLQYQVRRAAIGRAAVLGFALASAAWLPANDSEQRPSYPEGFEKWAHIKSAMVTSAHPAHATEGGLHHIYGNGLAIEGYSTGRFPDGAVVVYELLSTVEKDGVISEGPRKRVDVMVKDAKRYTVTGGWGFNRFYPGGDREGALREASAALGCFACHKQSSGHDFVFSRARW